MSASTKTPRIRLLAPVLIDKIAAGEVIEGPFSVIKELVENSLDAGARRVRVETRGGGLDRIVVEDDGGGIHPEDLRHSVERHATSKIAVLEDLEQIASFGFRGEALASIAAIAHLEIRSRLAAERVGGLLECRGGEITREEPVAVNPGTRITVSELFYSTPARRKFAKSERTENQRIYQTLLRIAFAHPEVELIYVRDDRQMLQLPPQELAARIEAVYRSGLEAHLLPVAASSGGLSLRGFITDERFFRANRDGQFQYINERYVEIKNFSYFVRKVYGELLPPGTNPYYFLFLNIDPARVDVNVHPAKREVRLLDESLLHGLVTRALDPVLRPRAPLAGGARLNWQPLDERPVIDERARGGPPILSHSLDMVAGVNAAGTAGPGVLFERPPATPAAFQIRREIDAELPVEVLPGSTQAPGPGGEGRPEEPARTGGGARTEFLPRRHFGVLFGTYILAEGDDGLYIIDQHTAHERINYEKMRRKLEGQRGQRQALLQPLTVDCLPDELERVLASTDVLLESGFLVEEYGPRAYAVREIPPYLEPGTELELVLHLIHRIIEGERDVRLYDEYAAMKACKASIKRNDLVSGEVLSEILRELADCENPSRCPHGRPTMLRISPEELDRMFHRV